MKPTAQSTPLDYDVAICGAGLAGLALARQLNLHRPSLRVLLLDQHKRPLPDSAFKVGESTTETGAHYLSKILDLEAHLESEQIEKLGLRYFFGGSGTDLSERPEFGVSRFLPAKSYQLDRGRLETHLRELAIEAKQDLREGAFIREICLGAGGASHEVIFEQDGSTHRNRCRWIIDATGRRRWLQRKLKLSKPVPGQFNAAWFRIKGRMCHGDWVDRSKNEWHSRVACPRWYSTAHLMGRGYWVWIIPLSPGNTSVGIVASEEFQPGAEYSTFDKALRWLERHEPVAAHRIRGFELMDFKFLKNYSYSSRQVFSLDRWACIGEASVFADPYYSVGTNLIAFANGFVEKLIEKDLQGTLKSDYVEHCNRLFLTLNDSLAENIHRCYAFFDNPVVMAIRTIWDYYVGWTTTDPQLYQEVYLDMARSKAMSSLISRVTIAQARMVQLFEDWARHSPKWTFGYIDYIEDLPTLRELYVRNLPPKLDSISRFFGLLRESIHRIEELAHFIFFFAVRDVLPEQMARLEKSPWINVTAISLRPDQWERDGLFAPKTEPRDWSYLTDEIGRHFRPVEAAATNAYHFAERP